jgi:L,D-transpeptidase YbiS
MEDIFSNLKSPEQKDFTSGESVGPDSGKPELEGESVSAVTPLPVNSSPNFTRKVLLIGLAVGLMLATVVLLSAPLWREGAFAVLPESKHFAAIRTADLKKLRREAQRLEGRVAGLRRRFERLTSGRPYLIVDTSENRVYLMSGKKVLHEGICSTGSYVLLKAGDERQWMFVTPRGMFHILGKREAPVWHKPDWAFIEEGLPVPPPNSPERFETGVLGEYALELGDGYLIHGTLYKRMLGMPVTHGCVRLGDEDLRIVYQNLQVGSKVFIY